MKWEGKWSDLFYFIDYARCLYVSRIRDGHHVSYYEKLEAECFLLSTEIFMFDEDLTEHVLYLWRSRLSHVLMNTKEASNDTSIMRALLRADHEIEKLENV